jgi:LysR family transcriptional regulator (chromosome initiation inhibitor)
MMNLDLAQLEALAAAVSEGTFDAAARKLHVTPSAVSQRVKALETTVGRVLLTRAKPVRPTPSGELLLRLARQIQTVTQDVAREIGGGDQSVDPVVIPLAVNADSLATWLLPALATVGPPVTFDLHRDDQERTADLLRQGSVMAAVTASAEPVPGCTVERLGRMRYRPTASPAFATRWFPDGVTTSELSCAPVVVFDREDRLQDRYLRRRTRRRLDPPRHYVPGSGAFVEAVRLGLGWGMLPDLQIAPLAAGGELLDLDPGGSVDVGLYWQQWRLRSAALELVADAVRTAAATELR